MKEDIISKVLRIIRLLIYAIVIVAGVWGMPIQFAGLGLYVFVICAAIELKE